MCILLCLMNACTSCWIGFITMVAERLQTANCHVVRWIDESPHPMAVFCLIARLMEFSCLMTNVFFGLFSRIFLSIGGFIRIFFFSGGFIRILFLSLLALLLMDPQASCQTELMNSSQYPPSGGGIRVPKLTSKKDYRTWKKLLQGWQIATCVNVEKRAWVVILEGIVDDEARDICLAIDSTIIESAQGLKKLIEELDRVYDGQDEEVRAYEYWKLLKDFQRSPNTTFQQYTASFARLRKEAETVNIKVSDTLYAYMLIEAAGLATNERLMIVSLSVSLAGASSKLSPEHVERALRRLAVNPKAENNVLQCDAGGDGDEVDDMTDLTAEEKEEILEQVFAMNLRGRPRMNAVDKVTGQVMTCHQCGSRFHLERFCPKRRDDRNSNSGTQGRMNKQRNYLAVSGVRDDGEAPALRNGEMIFLTHHSSEECFLTNDQTELAGIIDSACTKSCVGVTWLNKFEQYTRAQFGIELEKKPSSNWYSFGDHAQRKALFSVKLPFILPEAKQKMWIEVDVVSGGIPLLISRPTLTRMNAVLDFGKGKMRLLGREISLQSNGKGHLLLPLFFTPSDSHTPLTAHSVDQPPTPEASLEQALILMAEARSLAADDPVRFAKKIHHQMAHPGSDRLCDFVSVFVESMGEDTVKKVKEAIVRVTESCEVCQKQGRHLPRPRQSIPLSYRFNQVIAYDLTDWFDPVRFNKHIIHHTICLGTRLSAASFVQGKKSEEIVESYLNHWLLYFGPPSVALSDCGGEFLGSLITMHEQMGTEPRTTAGGAPFSNGCCERHNAILKMAMTKLAEADPSLTPKMILSMCLWAKNCLLDVSGYSPFQRAMGSNPSYPHLAQQDPPALAESPGDAQVRNVLNAMRGAREIHQS